MNKINIILIISITILILITMLEISVWNRTLTNAEITSLYNGGSGYNPYPIIPPNITVNDSLESTAIVKQSGATTLLGPTPQSK